MIAVLLLAGLADRAAAFTITPTFDSSFNSLSNKTQAESAATTAIATVDSLYAGSGNIPVLFTYDASLNGGAQSNNAISTLSYNSWLAKLQSISTSNPSNTTLTTAVAHLPASGTVSQTMDVTGVYSNLVLGNSLFLGYDASGAFHGTGGQTYAAVITLSAPSTIGNYYTGTTGFNSEAVSAAEHEIDEVLGGGGAGTTLLSSSTGTPTDYGPLDLYRYLSGTSTRSWSASNSITTVFSINGGTSAITDQNANPILFNQNGANGADYGDFASVAGIGRIQDAVSGANASPLYTSLSPEATMQQAIGYNVLVPEPTAMSLLGGGLAGLAFIRRRRSGKN